MEGKKILVLGMGLSGVSAAKFLLSKGAIVYGYDEKAFLVEGVLVANEALDLQEFDLVCVSPGVSPKEKHYAKALELGIEIIGEIELGARFLKNPCIGITGTNGKTTVTLLVEHVLNCSGKKAVAVGNVGKPLTTYLLENPIDSDILVIELSSYQIETLSHKILDTAVILNITPDHLDRYLNLNEYAKSKIKIMHCLKMSNFIVHETCFDEFKDFFQSSNIQKFGYNLLSDLFTDLENVYFNGKFEYKLPVSMSGNFSYEIENMMAAFALVKNFVTAEQFLDGYLSFKKPPHRLEFVKQVNLVTYYDDSKGTNIDAVMKAVASLRNPLYLIAGGVDKGASYEPWKQVFNGKVKAVFAIGQAANKIKKELFPDIEVEIVETLELAVKKAASVAVSGDSVLLSPGCSSFDMFKDYKDRGNAFKRCVNLLSKGNRNE